MSDKIEARHHRWSRSRNYRLRQGVDRPDTHKRGIDHLYNVVVLERPELVECSLGGKLPEESPTDWTSGCASGIVRNCSEPRRRPKSDGSDGEP